MKPSSLTLHHISMPLVAPFETSFGRETVRECVIVELHAEGEALPDEAIPFTVMEIASPIRGWQ